MKESVHKIVNTRNSGGVANKENRDVILNIVRWEYYINILAYY